MNLKELRTVIRLVLHLAAIVAAGVLIGMRFGPDVGIAVCLLAWFVKRMKNGGLVELAYDDGLLNRYG
jgi:hypothetical protein